MIWKIIINSVIPLFMSILCHLEVFADFNYLKLTIVYKVVFSTYSLPDSVRGYTTLSSRQIHVFTFGAGSERQNVNRKCEFVPRIIISDYSKF
jgi:hypothetical protein